MADLSGDLRSIADVVDEAGRLNILFTGTKTQPGLLAKVGDFAEKATIAADRLSDASRLSAQIEALPARLLKPADETQFRTALQESMSKALGGALEDARKAATEAGLSVAREDLQAAADEIFGDPVDLKAKLKAEELLVVALRDDLSTAHGAIGSLTHELGEISAKNAKEYGEKVNIMAEAMQKTTKSALDRIRSQNSWLRVKQTILAVVAFVIGHATHDWLYAAVKEFLK